MDTIASFGEWVKHRRRALRFTQAELADMVGCSVVLVRKIEADERRPSRQIAELLARHLGLPADQQDAFVRAARAELAPFRLPAPHHPIHARPARAAEPLPALPAPPNELIGRALDVARVSELLGQTSVRLVTLVGPPGVGKTRLGLAGAWTLSRQFAHGAVFVALAPLADAAQVLPAIARALELHGRPGQSVSELLRAFLRSRQMLLVLDNAEHVLDAAPEVATLLAEAPRLTVLTTSRAPLRLTSEHVYDVAPLAADAAVSLFTARAQQAWPAFELTDANRTEIVALVARLDHLPLAIELAAARASQFAPGELLAALERQLVLLVDGPRDLPPRQQTLRDAIAWSYELLDRDAQPPFWRLAVFAGGFTQEAAAFVCQLPLAQTRAVLGVLVASSLVQHQADSPGVIRYGLLETLREFALERLRDEAEEVPARERHAQYFCQFAEGRIQQLSSDGQAGACLDAIDTEFENIDAAMVWSMTPQANFNAGARIGGALATYWALRARSSAAGYRRILELMPHLDRAAPEAQAILLQTAAQLGVYWLDLVEAMEYGEHSLALCQRLGNQIGCITVLDTLRKAAFLIGNERLSVHYASQALSLARSSGNQQRIYRAASELARLAYLSGDDALFERLERECDQLSPFVSEPNKVTRMMHQVRVFADREHWELAQDIADDLEAICRKHGLDYWIATILRERAYIALRTGDIPQAQSLMAESVWLSGQLDDLAQEGLTQHFCALVALGCGRPDLAQHHAARAVASLREMRDPCHLSIVLIGAAAAALGIGNFSAAAASYVDALDLLRTLSPNSRGTQMAMAVCIGGIALCCARRTATAGYERAVQLCSAASTLRRTPAGRYALASFALPLPELAAGHDDMLTACRTGLGDAAFEAAWRAGAAMSWEQALAQSAAWA